uniref:Uncharacterized protein n=1 Tax=Seriola lalandi dorsalis TaxID=1841481 RepID=A0A3B4WNY0_SERLL
MFCLCTRYMYLVTHLCTCASHRDAKAKVHGLGVTALDFLGTYYEDHIQPVTDNYVGWASNVKSSMWEKIQTTIDNYSSHSDSNEAVI